MSVGLICKEDPEIEMICKQVSVLILPEELSDISDVNSIDADPNEHAANNIGGCSATIPPSYIERDIDEKHSHAFVVDTCEQILMKLDTVRLSVLHLKYSMLNAGSRTPTSINPCKQLWAWEGGGVFADDVVKGPYLPGISPGEDSRDEQDLLEKEEECQDDLSGDANFHIPSDIFSPDIIEDLQLPEIYDVCDIGGISTNDERSANSTNDHAESGF